MAVKIARRPARASTSPASWLFGRPILTHGGAGNASWVKRGSLGQFQKGTGWQAELNSGSESGDDWAAVYIPVNELPVILFESAMWSWYQTNAESYGLGTVIWMHDPEDFDKRAEVTQRADVATLEKTAGMNAHEFDTTVDQMYFYGEGTTGTTLTAGTDYTWDEVQADLLFRNWTIYRVSFDWGWLASGTLEDAWMLDLSLNGVIIPIMPSEDDSVTVRGKGGLKSSGVKTADVQVKATPGEVYWLTVSDTAAGVIGLADNVGDSTTYLWQITIPADGYAHVIFDPPLEFASGIWLNVPTGTPDVIVGYV